MLLRSEKSRILPEIKINIQRKQVRNVVEIIHMWLILFCHLKQLSLVEPCSNNWTLYVGKPKIAFCQH